MHIHNMQQSTTTSNKQQRTTRVIKPPITTQQPTNTIARTDQQTTFNTMHLMCGMIQDDVLLVCHEYKSCRAFRVSSNIWFTTIRNSCSGLTWQTVLLVSVLVSFSVSARHLNHVRVFVITDRRRSDDVGNSATNVNVFEKKHWRHCASHVPKQRWYW